MKSTKPKDQFDELSMINEIEVTKQPKILRQKTMNPISSPSKEKEIKIRDDTPTTITLNQEPITHLKSHPINKAIWEFNKAVGLIWSSRPSEFEKQILKLTKKLGYNFTWHDILEKNVVEQKDFWIAVKDKLISKLN